MFVLVIIKLSFVTTLVKETFVLLVVSNLKKIKTENILEKCVKCDLIHITFTTPTELITWFFMGLSFEVNLSMCLVCAKCNSFGLIQRSSFQGMTEEEFHNNKIFICNKYNVRMTPTKIFV